MSVQQRTGRTSGRVRQVAWALAPLLSLGLFAFVPFARLALARRRAPDWVVCGAYLAVTAAILLLPDSAGNGLVGGLALLLCGFATVHTLVAFRPGAGGPAPVMSTDTNRQALAR